MFSSEFWFLAIRTKWRSSSAFLQHSKRLLCWLPRFLLMTVSCRMMFLFILIKSLKLSNIAPLWYLEGSSSCCWHGFRYLYCLPKLDSAQLPRLPQLAYLVWVISCRVAPMDATITSADKGMENHYHQISLFCLPGKLFVSYKTRHFSQ